MSVLNCVICHHPQAIERMACTSCEITMSRQLTDIVEFYCLAEGELSPGSGTGARGTERGLGVRMSALDFLAGYDAVAILASWEGEWREHYGLSIAPMIARPSPSLNRSVAFLRAWLPRACDNHPAIDDFAHELRDCWSEGRSAARCSPPRNQSITCPADHPDDQARMCGYRIPIDADHTHGIVTCKRCRTDWDVMHLMHVVISTPGAEFWADPEAAAGYSGVHQGQLKKWARRGLLDVSHGRYNLQQIRMATAGETA